VDTVNKSAEAGKTTPKDEEMLRRLTLIVPDVNGDELYTGIQEAKNDVSGNVGGCLKICTGQR
jgi:hypothetical protein